MNANVGSTAFDTPERALKQLRVIWVGVTFGLVSTAAVIVAVTRQSPAPTPAMLGPLRVGTVALMALVVLMALGYFLRLQFYKRGWVADRVSPSTYVTGNLILFALLEAAGLLAVVLGGFVGDTFACFGIATAAFIALLLNFPNGGPMRQAQPRL